MNYGLLIKVGLIVGLFAGIAIHSVHENDVITNLKQSKNNADAKYAALVETAKIDSANFIAEKNRVENEQERKTETLSIDYANTLAQIGSYKNGTNGISCRPSNSLRINTTPNNYNTTPIYPTKLPSIPLTTKTIDGKTTNQLDAGKFSLDKIKTLPVDCEKTTLQLRYLQKWVREQYGLNSQVK